MKDFLDSVFRQINSDHEPGDARKLTTRTAPSNIEVAYDRVVSDGVPQNAAGALCPRCKQTVAQENFDVTWLRCACCMEKIGALCKKHPLYADNLWPFFRKMLTNMKGGEKRARRPAPSIDVLDLMAMFLTQDGRCYLTGWEMQARGNVGAAQATPCRLDARRGFTPTNVVLACQGVTQRMSGMGAAEFEKLCRAVVAFRQGEHEDELLAAIAGGASDG